MSSGLQQKMYNFEVTPPAGAWEKIAAELDESELSRQYPSRLHDIEITPPAYAWQEIAAALDEPVTAQGYAGKLSAMEVLPPPFVWEKIKTSLDTEQEAKISERRISPWLKYAAAAILTGVLAWGGIRLFDNRAKNTGLASKVQADPSRINQPLNQEKAINIPDKNIAVTDITASMDEARNDAALEASKKTVAKLGTRHESKIKNAAAFYFNAPEEDEYHPGTRGLDIEAIMPAADITSRYILLMTPDGNIIRMSKKLSDLVCCVSGEEQDKNCADQMKRWREKIANPSGTHSSGNFMDILSMVNSLQDN
ncbi:MAG: hypothetical protein ABIT05_14980 [Chitinophagaceae bacterium]